MTIEVVRDEAVGSEVRVDTLAVDGGGRGSSIPEHVYVLELFHGHRLAPHDPAGRAVDRDGFESLVRSVDSRQEDSVSPDGGRTVSDGKCRLPQLVLRRTELQRRCRRSGSDATGVRAPELR